MTTNYVVSGIITQAGITAAINAGQTGPNFDVSGFRIGSQSANEGATALSTDTDVDGFVYQGNPTQLSYNIVDQDTIMWTIALDTTVGNFEIGNVGIVMPGNVLLCKAVYPAQTLKYMSNPPTTVGNVLYYKILMRLANIASLINVTIIESLTASLPEVPTEVQLPDAFSSPYNAYMVDNHTKLGTPTVALRLNGNWFHAGHYSSAGMNDTVLPVPPAMFDTAVPTTTLTTSAASAVVAYHPATSTFVKMDSTETGIYCIGLRVSSYQIVTKGFVAVDPNIFGTLIPGTIYYADGGANAGKLTTTENAYPVALAIYSNYLWVDLEAFLNTNYATYTTPGIVRWATQTEVDEGFSDISGPMVKPDTLSTWATNGTLFNSLQSVGGEWDSITITGNYSATKFNLEIKISPSAATANVILLSPNGTSNGTNNAAQAYKVYNNSPSPQTIYTPNNAFVGPYFASGGNTYVVPPTSVVEFISDGTNYVVIDYYRIATINYYGIAREATTAEAMAGVTSGPAPAFITPEDLAAALHNGGGSDIFSSFNVGSYIIATQAASGSYGTYALNNNPQPGSTHTWAAHFENASGLLAICLVVDNENSLYIPAANWTTLVVDIANNENPNWCGVDSRFGINLPSGTMSTSNPPTITVPPGVWQVMFVTPMAYTPSMYSGISTYNRYPTFWGQASGLGSSSLGGSAQNGALQFWLKRIS